MREKKRTHKAKRENAFMAMGMKMLLGAVFGVFTAILFGGEGTRVYVLNLAGKTEGFLVQQFVWTIGILGSFMLLFNVICYGKLKHMIYRAGILEDDELLDALDNRIDLMSNIFMSVNGIFFVLVFMNYMIKYLCDENAGIGGIGLFLGIALIYVVFYILMIELLKKYDPSKQGNPGSMKFRKDWVSSCDEAEKMRVYRVGYQSNVGAGCILSIGFAAVSIIAMLLELDTYAVYVTGIMWIIYLVVNGYYTIKSQKEKVR